MNPIQSISAGAPLLGKMSPAAGVAKDSAPFTDFLLKSIHEVNAMQQDADTAVEQLMTGGEVNPAEVLTAVQKADVAFRLMLQVRNKIVQAYQEVNNIRV